MPRHELTVTLGPVRYRVDRPWGDIPLELGSLSDVACDVAGHVYVPLQTDTATDPTGPLPRAG